MEKLQIILFYLAIHQEINRINVYLITIKPWNKIKNMQYANKRLKI